MDGIETVPRGGVDDPRGAFRLWRKPLAGSPVVAVLKRVSSPHSKNVESVNVDERRSDGGRDASGVTIDADVAIIRHHQLGNPRS